MLIRDRHTHKHVNLKPHTFALRAFDFRQMPYVIIMGVPQVVGEY